MQGVEEFNCELSGTKIIIILTLKCFAFDDRCSCSYP